MSEKIDYEFIKNAACPKGEDGETILGRMNESHVDLTKWGFSSLKFGKTILDIGCGGGGAIERLSKMYEDSTIYGCDISPVSIECSKKKNKKLVNEGRVNLKVMSVSNLEYRDEMFDTAYSVESLYFWTNQQEDLKEVYRVLKKGGKFMTVLEMVGGSLSERSSKIAKHLDMKCPSKEELYKLLEGAGFKDIKVEHNKENSWLLGIGEK